jgi:hypothetical protein
MPGQHVVVYDNKGSDELIVRYMNLIFHFHPDGKIVISENHNEGFAPWIVFDGDELDLRTVLAVRQLHQREG